MTECWLNTVKCIQIHREQTKTLYLCSSELILKEGLQLAVNIEQDPVPMLSNI